MKHLRLLLVAILAVSVSACNLLSASTTPTITPSTAPSLEFGMPTPVAPPTSTKELAPSTQAVDFPQQDVLDQAFIIVRALKEKDFATLSRHVSPRMGLRFSPYAAVKDSDQVFTASQVAGLITNGTTYHWGAYDGNGKPIDLTFSDYYAGFIYARDFANAPQVALNFRIGVGTTLDNSVEFYQDGMVVEFHDPGSDAGLQGMDWRSLRLVFMLEGNTWNLVGIIHDQWTT